MKFIHFGDLHVWRLRMPPGDLFAPKRWLGTANLLFHRAALFPTEYRAAALEAIRAESPDVVVFTGDFTQSSLPGEFAECARLFAPLRETLGDRLFALPGNHDLYTRVSARKQWLQRALPWVHARPVTRVDFSGRLTLVGIDHSRPFWFRSNGIMRPDAEQQLRAVLAECQSERRTVILAGHYPYVSPPENPEPPDHVLLGAAELAEIVREFAPALYLHGHQHIRWALRDPNTPDTLCLNCGSASLRHPAPERQAGFLSWDQREDGAVRHLTAHTFDGRHTWRKTPVTARELGLP